MVTDKLVDPILHTYIVCIHTYVDVKQLKHIVRFESNLVMVILII